VVSSKKETEVANAILKNWIYIFGVPKLLVSDQGKEFVNKFSQAIWDALKIEHKMTSPYHPQTNAQAETFNKTMAHYLRTVIKDAEESNVHWEKYLGPLMFSHNTAVHKATLQRPFYTMFGYDPRTPLWDTGDVIATEEQESTGNPLADFRRTQEVVRKTAHHNNQNYTENYKNAFDKLHNRQLPNFKGGQPVWVRLNEKKGPNMKFSDKWEPAEIIEQATDVTYKVHRISRKRRKFITLNCRDIKPRTLPKDLSTQPDEVDQPPIQEEEEEDEENADESEPEDDNEDNELEDDDDDQQTPIDDRPEGDLYKGRVTRARSKLLAEVISTIQDGNLHDQIWTAETLLELFREGAKKGIQYALYSAGGQTMPLPQEAQQDQVLQQPLPGQSAQGAGRPLGRDQQAGPSKKSKKSKNPLARLKNRLAGFNMPGHRKEVPTGDKEPNSARQTRYNRRNKFKEDICKSNY
jgi:hypothetical protein